MKCTNCGTELENEQTVCPNCAAEQKPKRKSMKQRQKAKLKKMIIAITAGVLAVVLAVALILTGINDGWGRENNIYKKKSYGTAGWVASLSRDRVVVTLGDYTLTNGELQVLYTLQVLDFVNQYGSYLSYVGMDISQPLSQQVYDTETGLTWEQHFLQLAITVWVEYCASNAAADKANFQLPAEFTEHLAKLETTIKASAEKDGFSSVDDMLKHDLGENVRYKHYFSYLSMYYKNNLYLNELVANMEVTDAEIEKYFTDNETALKQNNGITKKTGDMVDVRHILVMPEGGTKSEDGKTTTYSDAEWEACRVKAQAIYDEWLNGEKTEESFGKLANEKSQDQNGQVTNGGLYENVSKGQMVADFENWIFADGRTTGDHGLVKTEYGYHVMYFVDSEAIWIRYCRAGVQNQRLADMIDAFVDNSVWTIDFSAIVLDNIELA